jgi:hypothetical protein
MLLVRSVSQFTDANAFGPQCQSVLLTLMLMVRSVSQFTDATACRNSGNE